jgi:TonB-dependent starch-binding outer membrane protein SusC
MLKLRTTKKREKPLGKSSGLLRASRMLLGLCFLLVITQASYGQITKEISGEVLDDSQSPLIGATVMIKGTKTGTVTDYNGKFKLSVTSPENAILVVSYVGYLTEEIMVSNQTNIVVRLIADLTGLEEVVVIGYGTMKKSDLTGAVSTVSNKAIEDRPLLSIEQALQGNAAGVQVIQNSGAPGASSVVRIRGMSTINNNDPLYIVDGTPVESNDINFLSANDIESIQVLKDASASAIYGSRGANGVIVITTKRGKNNSFGVDFTSYVGVQQLTKAPDVMNSAEYVKFLHDNKLPGASLFVHPDSGNVNYGDYNWWDGITQMGTVQNYSLSISGGGERNTYKFTTDYYKNEGAIKNTQYERLSVRINNEYKPISRITVTPNVSFTKSDQKGSVSQGDWGNSVTAGYMADPMTSPYGENGAYNGLFAKLGNPMPGLEIDIPNQNRAIYRLIGNLGLSANILKGLDFNSNLSATGKMDHHKAFYQAHVVTGHPGRPINSISEANRNTASLNWYNTLTYQYSLLNKHDFNFMVGQEYHHTKRNSLPVAGDSIPGIVPEFRHMYLAKNQVYTGSGNWWDQPSENALISYFGRFNYTYDNMLLFTATLRRDGSSRFGSGKKWGLFPSYALAFKLSELGVIKDISAINLLKVRVGYGEVGNQEIGDYTWSSYFEPKTDYNNNSTILFGSSLKREANPMVSWESQNSTNFGLDLSLFRNKVNFTGDYFIKKTEGVLYPVTLPLIMGLLHPSTQNVADIQNKGYEFSASYRDFDRPFGYEIGVNFTRYENKVLSLGAGDYMAVNPYKSSFSARVEEGYPIGVFYGFVSDGLYKDWEDVALNGFNNVRPGDVKFIDLNGDRKIDDDDKTYIGNPHPDFTFGVNINLRYKQFELSTNGYASIGNDVQYNLLDYTRSGTSSWNQERLMLDAWTPKNPGSSVPRLGNTANNVKHPSDLFLFDGSYFRLKRLALSYSLPSPVSQSIRIKGLTVYVAVENLFTITKYPGLEPEIGVNTYYGGLALGTDGGTFPQARTTTVGIKINL